MTFKVTKQYGRGSDSFCAEFGDLNDAKTYIAEKLEPEAKMGVKVTYRIYEFGELLAEFDPTKIPQTKSSTPAQTEQGSSGKGSGSTFSPTPFATAPRPSGTPPKWIKDDDEEKEKQ